MPDKIDLPSNSETPSTTIIASSFSGPVPDPQTLQKYELIHQGFADRIIQMAEKEQQYRHDKKMQELESNYKLEKQEKYNYLLGLLLAFLSVLLIVGLCAYGFHLGFSIQSSAIAVGVIVSLAGVFVIRKYQENKESH